MAAHFSGEISAGPGLGYPHVTFAEEGEPTPSGLIITNDSRVVGWR